MSDPFKRTEIIWKQTTVMSVLTNMSNRRAVRLPDSASMTAPVTLKAASGHPS